MGILSLASGTEIESWLDLIPGLTSLSHTIGEALGPTFREGKPTTLMHVFLTIVAIIAIVVLAQKAFKHFSVKAEGKLTARTFFELILDALMGLMTEQMGRKNAERFLPLIGTLAVFIFFCNAMALIPGFLPPTDNLNTTAAPALVVFFTTHIVGVKQHGFKTYFGHFLGPIHKWYALPLMLIMLPIEIISHVARPLSLSLRLLGNMFGDHAVLGIFLGILPFLLPLPLMVLGMVVVVVQTMVFCILSVIYISMAVEHAEEH